MLERRGTQNAVALLALASLWCAIPPAPATARATHITPLTPRVYHVLQDVAVSADGSWAVYVDNETVFVKKVASGLKARKKVGRAASSTEPLAISPHGATVTVALHHPRRDTLVRWTRATGDKLVLARGNGLRFAQSADGDYIAYVDGRGAVHRYSAGTGTSRLIARAPNEDECFHYYYYDTERSVAISDDGRSVVYSDCDRATNKIRLRIWRSATNGSSLIPGTRADARTPIHLTADGSVLHYMTSRRGGSIHDWWRVDLASRRKTQVRFPIAKSKRDEVQFAQFSSDGKWVSFAPEVWGEETGRRRIARFNSYVWRIGTDNRRILFKARRVHGDLVTGYPMNIAPDGSAVSVVAAGWGATPGSTRSMVGVWHRH